MSEMAPGTPENPEILAPPSPSPVIAPAPASPSFARRLTAAIAVAVVIATGGGIGIGWNLARVITSHSATATQHISAVQQVPQGSSSNGSANLDINGVSHKVSPAIVDINTTIQTANGSSAAAGTGLIITSTGDVLTNNHVVEGSVNVKVTIQGRS